MSDLSDEDYKPDTFVPFYIMHSCFFTLHNVLMFSDVARYSWDQHMTWGENYAGSSGLQSPKPESMMEGARNRSSTVLNKHFSFPPYACSGATLIDYKSPYSAQ